MIYSNSDSFYSNSVIWPDRHETAQTQQPFWQKPQSSEAETPKESLSPPRLDGQSAQSGHKVQAARTSRPPCLDSDSTVTIAEGTREESTTPIREESQSQNVLPLLRLKKVTMSP